MILKVMLQKATFSFLVFLIISGYSNAHLGQAENVSEHPEIWSDGSEPATGKKEPEATHGEVSNTKLPKKHVTKLNPPGKGVPLQYVRKMLLELFPKQNPEVSEDTSTNDMDNWFKNMKFLAVLMHQKQAPSVKEKLQQWIPELNRELNPVSREQDNPDKLVSIEGTKYLPVKMGKQHTPMEKQMLERYFPKLTSSDDFDKNLHDGYGDEPDGPYSISWSSQQDDS